MKFTYQGTELEGFDHEHNTTILNERAVELPVACQFIRDACIDRGGELLTGLEVGNVLGHYDMLVPTHRVVDRWEIADGVENMDVFDIVGSYDWIVSISTVEHVAWDTDPRDPGAAARAIEHLADLLAPGGRMLITVPAGYHPTLDEQLAAGVGARRACTLVRSKDTWRQTKKLDFKPYAASTPWAESVWIGEWGDQ